MKTQSNKALIKGVEDENIPEIEKQKDTHEKIKIRSSELKVSAYSPKCEDYSQIEKILPLKKSTCKFVLYIFLNIITVCLINLIIAWFPNTKLYLYYSVVDLKEATHMGIYGKQGKLVIKELRRLKFQPTNALNDGNIINSFHLNMNNDYSQMLTFEFRLFDYIYVPDTNTFVALDYFIQTTQSKFQEQLTTGINPNEEDFMRKIFGICDIDIKIDSILTITLNELSDPFYLFQLYSVILWYCTNYEAYATVIIVITIISSILSVYETYQNLKQLSEMSKYSCPVNVFRKNENDELLPPKRINSTELVPGDLYEIPEDGLCMPCDTILVSGSVIVNESMLTGESTPIIKIRLPSTEASFNTKNPECEKFILFAGTRIVQRRLMGAKRTMGVVYQTGFQTVKGNLIRTILFPKEEDVQFERDSVKYIIFMTIICVVGYFSTIKFMIDTDYTVREIIIRFLDLFTTTVPPSLPACISVGITYSLKRLKKKNIVCIKREALNSSGSVTVCVFDKTGTLTEDTLSISGYIPVKMNSKNKQFEFDSFSDNSKEYSNIVTEYVKNKTKSKNNFTLDINKDLRQIYVECLACCHCITYVNGNLVGDPIDVKMFEGTDWNLKENNLNDNSNYVLAYVKPKGEMDIDIDYNDQGNQKQVEDLYQIAIVRRFDFSSKLQRMTTIGKNINEDYYKAFCKGSPEKLKELTKPETWPQNFDELLNKYTTKGFRVLAMAYKSIKMNITQSQHISREAVEKDMVFLGLLIVKNQLKKATSGTISKLDKADLKMVMATGDNIFTAICISKECNLVNKNQEMFSCEIENDANGNEQLIWKKIEEVNDDEEEGNLNEICQQNTNKNMDMDNKIINIQNENMNLSENEPLTLSINEIYPPTQMDITFFNNDEEKKARKKGSIKRINNAFNQDEGEEVLNDELSYIDVDTSASKLSVRQVNDSMFNVADDNNPLKTAKNENFAIAITGPVFERLSVLNKKYLSKKTSSSLRNIHKAYRLVLKNGIVFARMAPEHKAILVRAFKEEGCMTLMCGDGANDCSALRTANVGVSLSPEEASIAASFTSKTADISCLIELFKEGKCSLTTSIETFKYMILYSFIQFFNVTIMIIYITYISDFQFLLSDLFIIFPLSWFLSRTKPADELTHKIPQTTLLSFPVIISIVIHAVFTFVFQFAGYQILYKYYKWNINICDFIDDCPTPCTENTILFIIAHYQYIGAALAFSASKPFRQRLYKNWLLIIYLVIIYFYSIWFTINCDDWSLNLITLYEFKNTPGRPATEEEEEEEEVYYSRDPSNMKYYLFLITVVNFIVTILFEWVAMHFIKNAYENYCDRKNEQEILREQVKINKIAEREENNNDININIEQKEVDIPISKLHKVFYYRRRKKLIKDNNN